MLPASHFLTSAKIFHSNKDTSDVNDTSVLEDSVAAEIGFLMLQYKLPEIHI